MPRPKIKIQLRKKLDVEIISEKEKKATEKKNDADAVKFSKRSLRKVSDIETGDIIHYWYKNPKTKDKMPKFDKTPLVVVIDTFSKKGKSYMYGVNLHWFPPGKRGKIFQYIMKNYLKLDYKADMKDKVARKTFFRMTYEDIKNDPELGKYLTGRHTSVFRLYLTHLMKDVRRLAIKDYDKIFKKEASFIIRARWEHKKQQKEKK